MLINDATWTWLFGAGSVAETSSFTVERVTDQRSEQGWLTSVSRRHIGLRLPAFLPAGMTCLLRLSPRPGLYALVSAVITKRTTIVVDGSELQYMWDYQLQFVDGSRFEAEVMAELMISAA